MKLLARVVALAITATALVATTTPAHAVGESTATSATAYAGISCIDQPVTYSINLPADAQRFYFQIKPVDPTGQERVSAYVDSGQGQPLSGTVSIQICGGLQDPGTWTLYPTLISWRDSAGMTHDTPIAGTPSTFPVVGVATAKLSLKGKTKGRKVTAKSKLVVTRDDKTSPLANQTVTFQKKVGRTWKTVKSVTTSASGVARARFKVKRKTTIRARFAGAGEVAPGFPASAIPGTKSRSLRVG